METEIALYASYYTAYVIGLISNASWSYLEPIFGKKITEGFRIQEPSTTLENEVKELLERNPFLLDQVRELKETLTIGGDQYNSKRDQYNSKRDQYFIYNPPPGPPQKKP